MAETEGVIKYQLIFTSGRSPDSGATDALAGWRELLVRLGMLGQDDSRYAGYGFGNISVRHPDGGFVISASQTGHTRWPQAEHYAWVTEVDLEANRVFATGVMQPSSEALSHAAFYGLDPGIQFVFHGHVPEIWRTAAQQGMPVTDPAVPYGTPEMAREVQRLSRHILRSGILAMAGHEDGVISFGTTANEAGARLVCAFAAGLMATKSGG